MHKIVIFSPPCVDSIVYLDYKDKSIGKFGITVRTLPIVVCFDLKFLSKFVFSIRIGILRCGL